MADEAPNGALLFVIFLILIVLAIAGGFFYAGWLPYKQYEESGKENKGMIAGASIAWIVAIVVVLWGIAYPGVILVNEILTPSGMKIFFQLGIFILVLWGATKCLIDYEGSGDKGKLAGTIILWIAVIIVILRLVWVGISAPLNP